MTVKRDARAPQPPRKVGHENDTFGDLPLGYCGRADDHDYHAVVSPDGNYECGGRWAE